MLIERIVTCWHHLYEAEQRMRNNRKVKGRSLAAATFDEKSVERAQKQYLQAISALALVRKLQLPTVQVNIADKQINLAQPGKTAPALLPYLEDEIVNR